MSDNFRHRREIANSRFFDVDSSTVIEIGDNLFLDTDDAKPASSFTWDTDIATTQRNFKPNYIGMSNSRSQDGDTDQIEVHKNGVKEFTCASATFEIGDLVGPAKASGNALEDQKVVAVATEDLAIGRVAKRYASATTVVEVAIFTFLDDFSIGSNPSEIVTALEALTGTSKLSADAIKDGTTNHVFTALDDTKLSGIEASADVTDATNVAAAGAFMASNMNASKVYAIAHTVTAGEASANQADIDTGFAAAPDAFIVQVLRAGVDVKEDAIITALSGGDAGKIRVAAGGATYSVTENDVIHLIAVKI